MLMTDETGVTDVAKASELRVPLSNHRVDVDMAGRTQVMRDCQMKEYSTSCVRWQRVHSSSDQETT